VKSSPAIGTTGSARFPTAALLVVAVLLLLFYQSFLLGRILFSNDGPLGKLIAECHRLPQRFAGCWGDLNAIGCREGTAVPNITYLLQWFLQPLGFSKFYPPVALLLLGLSVWCFLRQSGLLAPARILGSLAAILNGSFLSVACWGVASHTICAAMCFLALAALVAPSPRLRWARIVLAGSAVGMAVSEGADLGAIFSLYIAAFVLFQSWCADGPPAKKLAWGMGRLAMVALCAGLLAAQTVVDLIDTTFHAAPGSVKEIQTPAERWDWATQWSLPKSEILSWAIPGLFGYRMDSPNGGNYWGAIGRAAAWDTYFHNGHQGPPPAGFKRYSGGGFYAGTLVLLVSFWAALQVLRRKDSVFKLSERRVLSFWLVAGFLSLLLAFGRYAPFYRLVYPLPFFSSIRNPAKFLDLLSFSVVILFSYGVDGIWRKYVLPTGPKTANNWGGLSQWWSRAGMSEKRWVRGCVFLLAFSLAAWGIYAFRRPDLEVYLQNILFDQNLSQAVASFSVRQPGWFILFFGLAAGLVTLVMSGAFIGRPGRALVFLGVLLVVDLARADQPWIIYWDLNQKYASNPVLDTLRQAPWEHRVARVPGELLDPDLHNIFGLPAEVLRTQRLLQQLYSIEWAQHPFCFYNIQSLDVVQMPRVPPDLKALESTIHSGPSEDLPRRLLRLWELTNTRLALGSAELLDLLNQKIDPVGQRFRILSRFDVVPKPGVVQVKNVADLTAVTATNGAYAVFEFAGALPRARLYSHWQLLPNEQDALAKIAAPSFHPQETVLVSGSSLPEPVSTATNQNDTAVHFLSYSPARILLQAAPASNTVLLLNDRYDPDWKVRVDGKPAPLLRCNYLMRGVALGPGAHQIEFRFQPPLQALYVSWATVVASLLLLGVGVVVERRAQPSPTLAPTPPPQQPTTSPPPNGKAVQKAVRQPAGNGKGNRLPGKGK
jgi:hypothetical protein